uniref:ras-associating and dilute domain-containing protein-like isoform X3 n=1 Tax=Gasterosteus aculeatus aculeatus TaxID=481459 RepID=UPI001A99441F|nr:ras-associating and dilute domain-containing protein-like isoform X3 [Gasterosteus aculeatus aculeatus]
MSQTKLSQDELRSLPPRAAGLPTALPRRRFVKLGGKTSDGSQQSATSAGSSSTSRSAEVVAVKQPGRSRIRHQTNRLSGVFRRDPTSNSGSMPLASGIRATLSIQSKKQSMFPVEALRADDPSELSNQITAPGILKIFGNEICEGAHYKSVLATTHSSGKELVKEALERYGLDKEEAESYVMCDTIGSTRDHRWRTEGFRVVSDNEKPLILQSLWKPKKGLARRFEIQRRSLIEEKTSNDKDTVTAGINAQARKLQKSRSRVTSTLIENTSKRGHKLWRRKSEMDLLDFDTGTKQESGRDECCKDRSKSLNQTSLQSSERPEQNCIQSPAVFSEGNSGSQPKTEGLCPPTLRDEREGEESEESEREATESSNDNTILYSIHPPHDCPYLLSLQAFSPAQDFVIYLLIGPNIAFGRQSDHDNCTKPDTLLFAPDILPRHCHFQRHCVGGPTVLRPSPNATLTRNGEALRKEVQLMPGDIIGMGQSYLFLFKDPLASAHKEEDNAAPQSGMTAVPWLLGQTSSATTTSHIKRTVLCNTCITGSRDPQKTRNRRLSFLKSPECHIPTLVYESKDEERIVKEIVAMGRTSEKDGPPLTVAFLLCRCMQYSSTCLHSSDLRRLLLLIANRVQSAVWEDTKCLAVVQSEVSEGSNPEDLQALGQPEAILGLRPLAVWMSNSLELLQFIQCQLPLILKWRTRKEKGQEVEEGGMENDQNKGRENLALLALRLSSVRTASEETMAVLEDVIMLAFQQCVYYITKILYPVLPALLDSNPFRESPDLVATAGIVQVPGSGLRVPGEIQHLADVLTETWRLLRDCQLPPEISSQLVGYLFYFINASLFNLLMERGSEPGFYQWARGVRMRANLDLLLDWAHAAGLGELASEHTHTLSSAINLLATPRKNLLQTSWVSLRSEYPALSPAQLNHLLSLYSPASPSICRHTWTPSVQDRAAANQTADILESFDTHHPLVLPDEGYHFLLGRQITDVSLREQLDKLKEYMAFSDLQSDKVAATEELIDLELEGREAGDANRSAQDPSCLLTPPNNPRHVDPVEKWMKGDSETLPWSSSVNAHDEGGLVFECLAALEVDCSKLDSHSVKRFVNLKEEEEEVEEVEEAGDHHNDSNDEVFSLELERGEQGLGLTLVDTRDSSTRAKGVFVRAVVPDSPAARCARLVPGDRILAVNGVSLLGLDFLSGKELIQSSGDSLRLLVARSDWMAATIRTDC